MDDQRVLEWDGIPPEPSYLDLSSAFSLYLGRDSLLPKAAPDSALVLQSLTAADCH